MTVTAGANSGAARSATVTIAGVTVAVSEAAPAVAPPSSGRVNVAAGQCRGHGDRVVDVEQRLRRPRARSTATAGASTGCGRRLADATVASIPDWLQVDFAGARSITEIRVVTVQDD